MSASQESMNICTKPSFSFRLSQIFKETFICLPFVVKQTTFKFCSVWFPIVFLTIGLINYLLLKSPLNFETEHWLEIYLMAIVQITEKCFIVFIVPYFVSVFRNQQKNKSSTPFWEFISENVFPLFINHVKGLLVILLHGLFFIIPGFIRALRYIFVTQACFFDKDYQTANPSPLRSSLELTKGRFLDILFIFFLSIFIFISSKSFFFLINPLLVATTILKPSIDIVKFVIDFYIGVFSLTLITQTYFVFRKLDEEKSKGIKN